MNFICIHCRQSLSAESSLYGQELECPACYNLVEVPAPKRVVKARVKLSGKAEFSKVLPILLIVFPSLTCMSLMLPWADIGFISASGFRKLGTENALFLMAMMAVPLIGGVISLLNGRYNSRVYAVFSVFAVVLAVALMLFFYGELSHNLDSVNARARSSFLKGMKLSIGIGFPLAYVFVVVTLFSSVGELFKKRSE